MSKFIDDFWKDIFSKSVCVYCGKGGVSEVYHNYACHSICEKKANYKSLTEKQIKDSNFPMKVTFRNS